MGVFCSLWSQMSATKIRVFRLSTLFKYPLSRHFSSGGSPTSTSKRFVVWGAAAWQGVWQGPTAPSSPITNHRLCPGEREPASRERELVGTGKTLGNMECVSAAITVCTASPWAASASSVRQQNLVEVSMVQLNTCLSGPDPP